MPTEAELLKEIVELQKELERYERKFIACCNENKKLKDRLARKRMKKIKHEAGML